MREISTLEVAALVKELKSIEGAHIGKFYELRNGQFRIRLSREGEKINLNCILSHTLNRSVYIEKQEEPTNFSLGIRAKTEGIRVNSVAQLNYDRIIDIDAGKEQGEVHIILEMFGKGNFILTDGSMKIIMAYRIHDYRDRSIRPKVTYRPPKAAQQSIGDLSDDNIISNALKELLGSCGKEQLLVAALVKALNLGGIYVEEAVLSSGMELKAKVGDVNDERIESLAKCLGKIIGYAGKPEPKVFLENGRAIDYAICDIRKYEAMEKKAFAGVSEMLDFFYSINKVEEISERSDITEQLKASIKKQEELIESVKLEAEESRAAGEGIFNRMTEINDLIRMAKQNKHITKEELEKAFPGMKILEVNLKDKTISIEM